MTDRTWDDAWKFVIEKSNVAKAAGNMDGYYACNRVLHAMDEARRLTPPPQPQQQRLDDA